MAGDFPPNLSDPLAISIHIRRILMEPTEAGLTHAEELARKLVELAKQGNATALKQLLDLMSADRVQAESEAFSSLTDDEVIHQAEGILRGILAPSAEATDP